VVGPTPGYCKLREISPALKEGLLCKKAAPRAGPTIKKLEENSEGPLSFPKGPQRASKEGLNNLEKALLLTPKGLKVLGRFTPNATTQEAPR